MSRYNNIAGLVSKIRNARRKLLADPQLAEAVYEKLRSSRSRA